MQFFSFEIVIEKEAEDSGYFAWSPSLPGCDNAPPIVEYGPAMIYDASVNADGGTDGDTH